MSHQIASDLREQILSGHYKAGQQLPSNSALMSHYNVARATVQRAIDQLRAEGLLITRPGAGAFVREQAGGCSSLARAHVTTDGEPYVIERVATRYATPEDAAGSMTVEAGQLVYVITRTTVGHDGQISGHSERMVIPARDGELVYEIPVGHAL